MKISELFPADIYGNIAGAAPDSDISVLTADSRRAGKESVFVCIRGAAADGHEYAPAAYRRGCRVFVCEYRPDIPSDALVITVPDARRAVADLAERFYGYPASQLKLIGITGTKGKSTVAEFIYRILSDAGYSAAVIGTCGVRFGSFSGKTDNTTPDALALAELFVQMRDSGVEYVVMEVSSQAFKLDRVYGLHFDYAVFTNLSPDHIGPTEHPDFEDYVSNKAKLFREAKHCVINAGSRYASRMADSAGSADISFYGIAEQCTGVSGTKPLSEVRWLAESPGIYSAAGAHGMEFDCCGDTYRVKMPGMFSVCNALAAIAVCRDIGILPDPICRTLSEISVPGRFETIEAHGRTFVIDYAHNGVSLESSLSVLRNYTGGRLIVLFGSIGGRAQLRRREMAEVADRLADFCIVTSDNPDREDPDAIIDEICLYIKKSPFIRISDRGEAIRYAVSRAERGDVVLLAGKGHENYQLVNGKKLPFSERAVIEKALEEAYQPVL